MKKAYLLLLAGMLSTAVFAGSKQTIKIDGQVIEKTSQRLPLMATMLFFSITNGHQQPLPALASILDAYTSGVVKVFGESNASGEGGSTGGGETGGSTDGTEGGSTKLVPVKE